MQLPDWAEAIETAPGKVPAFNVNADKFYPAMFKLLGFDPKKITKFELECAFQAMKMEMQIAAGFGIEIRVQDPKKKWALADYPGDQADIDRATKGKAARELYRNARGFIPS